MHRVIIVDDEPWAILVVKNAFNWEAYGFQVIAETTSAEKAFDLICSEKPDLVFTDVRMTKLSGIDLIRMTREKNIDTEFIIISGFAEFSFAQEALRYGALDYCLKPIDFDMTEKLLRRLHAYFNKKRDLRNNLLLEALLGNDKNELVRLEPLFYDSSDCFWCVLIVYMNNEMHNFRIEDFICSSDILCVKSGSKKMLYIIKYKSKNMNYSIFDKLLEADIASAGVSRLNDSLENISKSIRESDLAASRIFITGEKNVSVYNNRLNIISPFIDKISSALGEESPQDIPAILDSIKEAFFQYSLGMAEVVYLWNQIVGILINNYYEEAQYMELEFLNYSELKERFKDLDSLLYFLKDVFSQLGKLKDSVVNEGDINSYFIKLVKYIDNNFQRELYLKDLAAKYFINQIYCCQLFKKVLGKTFSEYVTELRINKACELLKVTDLSIEEVAQKVGYEDYYYFNKVFKKKCEITPAKYRKGYSDISAITK